jgi:hypothetical protein
MFLPPQQERMLQYWHNHKVDGVLEVRNRMCPLWSGTIRSRHASPCERKASIAKEQSSATEIRSLASTACVSSHDVCSLTSVLTAAEWSLVAHIILMAIRHKLRTTKSTKSATITVADSHISPHSKDPSAGGWSNKSLGDRWRRLHKRIHTLQGRFDPK